MLVIGHGTNVYGERVDLGNCHIPDLSQSLCGSIIIAFSKSSGKTADTKLLSQINKHLEWSIVCNLGILAPY